MAEVQSIHFNQECFERYQVWRMKTSRHPFQELLQDDSHDGLNPVSKEAFFQCDKETVSFKKSGRLKLNTTYKQEFHLTNISGKELDIEFYTTGFKEPHEIVFSPNSCIIFFTTFVLTITQSNSLRMK